MAEALAAIGLAASIVQLVDVSVRMSAWLKDFTLQTSDAPSYCRSLITQTEALTFILRRIQERLNPDFSQDDIVQQLTVLVNTITSQVLSLQRQLSSIIPQQNASKSRRTWNALKGAVSEPTIRKLSEDLSHSITILSLFQNEGQSLALSRQHQDMHTKITSEHELSRDIMKLEISQHINHIQTSLDDIAGSHTATTLLNNVLINPNPPQQVSVDRLQKWINAILSAEELSKAIRQRTPETCDWVLDRDFFQRWKSSTTVGSGMRTLWIHGGPGFGKTVLCAHIIQYLQQNFPSHVAYFFCTAEEDAKRQPISIVRSWIGQMIEQNEAAVQLVREAYGEMNGQQGRLLTTSDIWSIFKRITQRLSSCFFIVDGFDECMKYRTNTNDHNNQALEFLESLLDIAPQAPCNILFVSREDPDLRSELPRLRDNFECELDEYEIVSSDTEKDLRLFADAIVTNKLRRKTEDLKSEISEKASERSQGMFLWIQLLGNHLRQDKNAKELRKLVKETPIDVRSTYTRDLEYIMQLGEERERALNILRWTLFAARPLTVRELTEALAIDLDDDADVDCYPVDNLPDSWDQIEVNDRIRRLCGSLIAIENNGMQEDQWQNNTVQLIHFSVREFLLESSPVTGTVSSNQLFPRLETEHEFITRACIRYMSYSEVRRPKLRDSDHLQEHLQEYGFLAYAAEFMWPHAGTSQPASTDLSRDINLFFDPEKSHWIIWACLTEYWNNKVDVAACQRLLEDDVSTAIYYVSLIDNIETLRYLRNHKLFANDDRVWQDHRALYAAVGRGHKEVAIFLIEQGANVRGIHEDGTPTVMKAAQYGHTEILEALCSHGADVHAAEPAGGLTAIHVAALNGYEDAVRILVKYGADAEMRTGPPLLCTPLQFAATSNHLNLVKFFIEETKASVNTSASRSRDAISVASSQGHLDMVKYLISERNVPPSPIDNEEMSPFLRAVHSGHLDVVKYLFDLEDPEYTALTRYSAYSLAAQAGHLEVLKFLFERQLDRKDIHDFTLMCDAAESGRIEILEYLLDRRTFAIDFRDVNGWTVLHDAAKNGRTDLIKYILERSQQSLTNAFDLQSVIAAAQFGYIEIITHVLDAESVDKSNAEWHFSILQKMQRQGLETIKLLIDIEPMEPTSTDDKGWTVLHAAAAVGDKAMFEFILHQYPAQLQLEDSDQKTPLQLAVKYGRIGIVQSYQQHHGDIDLNPPKSFGILHFAAVFGQVEMVKFLMKLPGASECFNGTTKWTPLHIAGYGGAIDVSKFLIDTGLAKMDQQDSEGFTPIHLAIENGQLEYVKCFLGNNRGIDLLRTESGSTLTHIAATNGQVAMAELLLQLQLLDVLAKTNEGRLPIHAAAQAGACDMVKFLHKHGSSLTEVDGKSLTPLHVSARCGSHDVASYLLSQKVEVGGKATWDDTPLHLASGHGNVEVVNLLLQHGADIESKNSDGWTPLYPAARYGYSGVVEALLILNANVYARAKGGWTPLHSAARYGHLRCVELLLKEASNLDLNDKNETGTTPLLMACEHGSVDIVNALLEKGADINATTNKGGTAIHFAAYRGHTELLKFLLEKKIAVNMRGINGWTPLMEAARHGHIECVRLLLDERADPNLATERKSTALHLAASNNHVEIVKLLLESSADGWAKNGSGCSPIHSAVSGGHMETIHAIINVLGVDSINAKTGRGYSSLHLAAEDGRLQVCQLLVEQYHAEHNTCVVDESLPIHFAAQNGHIDVVKYLIRQQADPNARGHQSQSLLHVAALGGKVDMVKYLCEELNLDIHVLDGDNSTPLHSAANEGHVEVAKYLITRSRLTDAGVIENQMLLDGALPDGDTHEVQSQSHPTVNALMEHKNDNGDTPLGAAVAAGQLEFVRFLVEENADLCVEDNNGYSLAFIAVSEGHLEVLEYLSQKHDYELNRENIHKQTILDIACERGNVKIVEFLTQHPQLNPGDEINDKDMKPRWNALHAMSHEGNLELVEMLLRWRPLLQTVPNESGWLPIHLAARRGHVEVYKLFTQLGNENDNCTRSHNQLVMTTLHAAAYGGQADLIELILSAQKDPTATASMANLQLEFDDTPLHIAIHAGSYSNVVLLLDHGADGSLTDGFGCNLADWALVNTILAEHLGDRHQHIALTEPHIRVQKLRNFIVRLCERILQSVNGQSIFTFDRLGRCLLFVQDIEAALIAFQQRLVYLTGDSVPFEIAECDGCKKEIGGDDSRFVCTVCPGCDLCEGCHGTLDGPDSKIAHKCSGHEYLEIPPGSAEGEYYATADTLSDATVNWLQQLGARYQEIL